MDISILDDMKKLPYFIIIAFWVMMSFVSCKKTIVSWGNATTTSTTLKPRSIQLDVYVENSGSMCGYLVDGSELKDAIYSYVSALDGCVDTTRLFFINSGIFPYKESIKSFIHDMTPTGIMSVGGNKSNSNIDEMFEIMLGQTNTNHVSIFVSDCILDVPEGDAVNFFEHSKITIRNAFRRKMRKDKDFGVVVFRMVSRYSGNYFLPTGGVERLDSIRPYYVFVMGNKGALAYLNSKSSYNDIIGLENMCAFTSTSALPFDITNSFGKPFPQRNMEVRPNKQGNFTICIKADFRPTLQDEVAISFLSNYFVDKNTGITLKKVEQLKGDDTYTHELTLEVDGTIKSSAHKVEFMVNGIPGWVDRYNDDSGKNIRRNIEKTTGIKYIIQGIADAFTDEGKLKLGEFNFIINRK